MRFPDCVAKLPHRTIGLFCRSLITCAQKLHGCGGSAVIALFEKVDTNLNFLHSVGSTRKPPAFYGPPEQFRRGTMIRQKDSVFPKSKHSSRRNPDSKFPAFRASFARLSLRLNCGHANLPAIRFFCFSPINRVQTSKLYRTKKTDFRRSQPKVPNSVSRRKRLSQGPEFDWQFSPFSGEARIWTFALPYGQTRDAFNSGFRIAVSYRLAHK